MKKILSIVCMLLLFNSIIYSQGTPQKFNYQGVARNANGSAIANEEIGIMISIQDESGEPYYVESHERILTNAMGLFTIQVGTGETNSIFANIPWGDLPLFMQVSMRPPKVGDTWMLMGTTELISMPYAIHAKEAETVLNNPSQWKDNSEGIYYNKGSVAIGTADAPNSAALTVNSQTQGFLPPRMTTVERDAIENPDLGLVIFNTETLTLNFFSGEVWCAVEKTCEEPTDPCGGVTSFEYGGQTYYTVAVGDQCWMKENLNIGTVIYSGINQSNNQVVEKYCYGDDINNCNIYGGLYQWNELMDYKNVEGSQGICPQGWHIPTNSEWTYLSNFTGGLETAGGKLKETGNTHWADPNVGATDEYGFKALPGGHYYDVVGFDLINHSSSWYSSTEYNSERVWGRSIMNAYTAFYEVRSENKNVAISVRCIKD